MMTHSNDTHQQIIKIHPSKLHLVPKNWIVDLQLKADQNLCTISAYFQLIDEVKLLLAGRSIKVFERGYAANNPQTQVLHCFIASTLFFMIEYDSKDQCYLRYDFDDEVLEQQITDSIKRLMPLTSERVILETNCKDYFQSLLAYPDLSDHIYIV